MNNDSIINDIIMQYSTKTNNSEQFSQLVKKVRDIPYGSIGSRDPIDVYHHNCGTCSGKHELLKLLLNSLGYKTKDYLAIHKFKDMPIDYPKELQTILDENDIIDPHNFFKVLLSNKWITIDITWDSSLQRYGFETNKDWDSKSDMKLCVVPLEIVETTDPIQYKKDWLSKLPKTTQDARKHFLDKLTIWLGELRIKN